MTNRALIIANSRYEDEHFEDLPAAAADAAALAEVLADPSIGDFAVDQLVDAEQRAVMRALEGFFDAARSDDLLLLHLSLHGWKDLRNRLYFVVRDTERDFPGSTAVSAEFVADRMAQSRSRRIVLMLDCCYSGAFTINTLRRSGSTPAVDVAEPFAGNGRMVLTASTSLQYAHEGEQNVRSSRARSQPSVFTSAVVRGLRDGSADLDGDGLVSVDELYEYVHEQVRQRVPGQTPTLSVDSAQGAIYLARSARHADTDLLAEMRGAVTDPQSWKRIGSLHLVERLLGSVREQSREAARTALLGLVVDMDREVARRARELWHARGLGDLPTARPTARPTPPRRAAGDMPVGIDFGTTNSSIAVLEGDDVRLIPNPEGALTTPSLVAIGADGQILVGAAAKRQALANPDHTVRSVKVRLGTEWSITRGDLRLTAEQVAQHILAQLREDAEAYLGGPFRGAILTVPAYFRRPQRAALVRAAEAAGIRVLRMINEPTAAAMTFGLNRAADATALIFDLGGGTLDVSLVEIADGVCDVKATSGDNHLGGDDWDRRLAAHLAHRIHERSGVDVSGDPTARHRLLEAAEAAKVELSSAVVADVRLPYLTTGADGPLHVDERVTRDEFEAVTRDVLERCARPVEQAVRDAGIALPDLDHIVLVGGATRMPAIAGLMRRLTRGKQAYRGLIPEGIVTGAALEAGVLTGHLKDVLLLDVTPMTIGVQTQPDRTTTIVKRNRTIPTLTSTVVATTRPGQTDMVFHIVEGDHADAEQNASIALLELSGLTATPAGTPLVEVIVDIDANGTAHVTAKELRGPLRDLPRKARELRRIRADWRYRNTPVPADFYTGREAGQTAIDAVELVGSLRRSGRWTDIRRLMPAPWDPDPV
ncbi:MULTISPECIES: Hsp70 family protein [unclassified Micromonospora]|uniref:caspase, EACC1-associated type n=1 Tax=unclassified Micromonospora TaxID=2617518 RepID=UPI0022B5E60F|nr:MULTISPECIES: Hsp70 family protein [unclassified Micromonospora]MCZ7423682.1 Hsp70 family protein [Verrucosispora sp. WMMA2121]WBB91370.1 Hsp70 family protein [Verrucosispora sp. WMMC514]